MEKNISQEQNKKNKWKQIKNNKKLWKWTIGSLAAITFGASAVMNITYVPKYFALKNHDETAVNINITATDDQNHILINLEYQTAMTTLGDLMSLNNKVYDLQTFSFGHLLLGIYYIDENNKEQYLGGDLSKGYWEIFKNSEVSQIGIDDIYLNTNDTFQLIYTPN